MSKLIERITVQRSLAIWLVVISLAIAGIGLLAQYQTEQMWEQVASMHDHPVTVRDAAGALADAVWRIERANRKGESREIAAQYAFAQIQLGVLRGAYLGPQADLDLIQDNLALLLAQPTDAQLDATVASVIIVAEYSKYRADKFYVEAERVRGLSKLIMSLAICMVLLFSWGIVYWLIVEINAAKHRADDILARYRELIGGTENGHR